MVSALQTTTERAASQDGCAELYRLHVRRVSRWAIRLGGPTVEAEDLVHDVFVVAFAQLPSFRGEAQPSTWLFRITERVALAHRRRARRRRWLAALLLAEPSPWREPTWLGAGHGAADVIERRQAVADLYRALERLDERHRTAFILAELDELPAMEIAAMLQVAESTVRVWVHRARKALGSRLARFERARAARAEAARR